MLSVAEKNEKWLEISNKLIGIGYALLFLLSVRAFTVPGPLVPAVVHLFLLGAALAHLFKLRRLIIAYASFIMFVNLMLLAVSLASLVRGSYEFASMMFPIFIVLSLLFWISLQNASRYKRSLPWASIGSRFLRFIFGVAFVFVVYAASMSIVRETNYNYLSRDCVESGECDGKYWALEKECYIFQVCHKKAYYGGREYLLNHTDKGTYSGWDVVYPHQCFSWINSRDGSILEQPVEVQCFYDNTSNSSMYFTVSGPNLKVRYDGIYRELSVVDEKSRATRLHSELLFSRKDIYLALPPVCRTVSSVGGKIYDGPGSIFSWTDGNFLSHIPERFSAEDLKILMEHCNLSKVVADGSNS